jgi:hypothetical protein
MLDISAADVSATTTDSLVVTPEVRQDDFAIDYELHSCTGWIARGLDIRVHETLERRTEKDIYVEHTLVVSTRYVG